MNLNQISASKYLAKTDVPPQGIILTVASFEMVKLDSDTKLLVNWMEGGVKPMIVNKTNRSRLMRIFNTEESQAMIGQRVCVYCDPDVEMGGEIVGGLRVRPAGQPQPIPAAPQPAYTPGHMPNPGLGKVYAGAGPPPVVGNLDGANWTDEVPF